ncbi:hypothetical protein Adt_48654 [Abeliophyllum distichum]|uniref:Uncharacterized protein n=1 Tax=Abeliophyllum distichum TaxID=126358 RepID=A0ABD1NSD2_9LAMI
MLKLEPLGQALIGGELSPSCPTFTPHGSGVKLFPRRVKPTRLVPCAIGLQVKLLPRKGLLGLSHAPLGSRSSSYREEPILVGSAHVLGVSRPSHMVKLLPRWSKLTGSAHKLRVSYSSFLVKQNLTHGQGTIMIPKLDLLDWITCKNSTKHASNVRKMKNEQVNLTNATEIQAKIQFGY